MISVRETRQSVGGPGEWRVGSRTVKLDHPVIAGIINVTPDSFSDGGEYLSPSRAIAHARRLISEGAEIIDIGGESTRPGAEPVPAEEEARRVLPAVAAIRERWPDVIISVDTSKADIADAALHVGADVVNDVSALQLDGMMSRIVAKSACGVVLMHSRGTVADMASYDHAIYSADSVGDVVGELSARARFAEFAGIDRDRIVLDPGLGFAKRTEHSVAVLRELDRICALGYPVMVGTSRKRFVRDAMATGAARVYRAEVPVDPEEFSIAERDAGTVGASVLALTRGALLFRVHDVRTHRRALDVAWGVIQSGVV